MAPAQEETLSSGKMVETVESKEEVKEERPPPPAWLNKLFLQKALKQESDVYGEVEEHIDNIEVEYATAVGDNYCSCIFRTRSHLRGRTNPRSLLVKCLPQGDTFRQLVQETRLFPKEGHMFSVLVPAMEALLEAAAPGRYPPFIARCLHHGDEPSNFIVVQDLRSDGFRLANRHLGMDLPHALVAVKALGRFHGASSVLWKKRPELFDMLDSPFEKAFGKEEEAEDFLVVAAGEIASWNLPGEYDKKVLSLKGKLFEKVKDSHHVRPGKFNVLNHGDFWLNNMMFRSDGEDVREVRFLDLQMSHITNPAFDLMLLRYTSLQEDVFFNHWDTLLEAYTASMQETLHALGEEAPTLDDIHRALHEARHFCAMAGMMWMPLVRLDEGKYDVEDALTKGADSQANVYKTRVFRHWMEKLLPIFDEQGVFDL